MHTDSLVIRPASRRSNGAAQIAPMSFPMEANLRIRLRISVLLRRSKIAGPPGMMSRSKEKGSESSVSKQSVCRVILDRPVTTRVSEQEARVTSESARRRRSIGTMASISSNPGAIRTSAEGDINRANQEVLLFSFFAPDDFFASFLDDESGEADDFLSDELLFPEDLLESEAPESPELSLPLFFL